MSKLPQNWCTTMLGELVEFKYGKALPDRIRSGSGFPVYGSNGIVGYHNDALTSGTTVIVGRKGSVGEINYSNTPCSPIDTTYYIDKFPGDVPRYWFYQLKILKLNELNKATAIPGLNRTDAYNQVIALAPLNEQKRIADKLDALLARVDACRERLDHIPAILKRFRQAVLTAATTGKLTEDWRIENAPQENVETALAIIESSRKGHLRIRRSEATLDSLDLFDLPDSWSWIKNHRLAVDAVNAICAGPFGTIFKAKDFRDAGIPIIFLRHVGDGKYLTNKPGFMDTSVWRKLHQEYSVQGGELLVTKLGDPPGTACIYPRGVGVAMVTPDVMKMEVDDQAADPRYLMYFFNAPSCKNLVRQLAFGVTRLRIDLAMFKNFPIPLPPRIEQAEIIHRVETLFAYADRLEARYTAARAQVEKLTPVLLAKAFRGELVPQDPNDEPASVLLERIRAAAPAPTKRNNSKTVNSATGS